jgi:hypothetical protein
MLINLELYQNLDEKIDRMVHENDIDYLDAIITYCSNNDLELETIGEIISSKLPTLKAKIELEAETLHFIKPTEHLPI